MEDAKAALLERFRAYLEEEPGAREGSDAGIEDTDETDAPDLFTLLAELAALKNEVKLGLCLALDLVITTLGLTFIKCHLIRCQCLFAGGSVLLFRGGVLLSPASRLIGDVRLE
jgi:hypothetical protein